MIFDKAIPNIRKAWLPLLPPFNTQGLIWGPYLMNYALRGLYVQGSFHFQTRLDQFKEDAGRNCVNYMLTALHHWRDTQNPDNARRVLIR